MGYKPSILVVSGGFPGRKNGAALAHLTALELYREADLGIGYVGLLDLPIEDWVRETFRDVKFVAAEVRRNSALRRFIRSLLNKWPGCSQQYVSSEGFRRIRNAIVAATEEVGRPRFVIVEHTACGPSLDAAADLIRGARLGFRSHDVLTTAFGKLATDGPMYRRAAWRQEVRRVRALEGRLLRQCHSVWAITEEDSLEYKTLFGRRADGVLGVHVDMGRFDRIQEGEGHTVVHLGGTDARKAHGLKWFLREVWPLIRRRVPDARFLLGGIGSEAFADCTEGVEGCGLVQDDVEFMGQGRIFVNTQHAGSGIKLKSLNAMAGGRLLVSTANGVRGIPGESGVHFLASDDPARFASYISDGLMHWNDWRSVALAGKALVASKYSMDAVRRSASESLDRFFDGR